MKNLRSHKRKQNDDVDRDSDETFYFIAGDTSGGVPYGLTKEEVVAQELTFRKAEQKDAKSAAELIHLAITDIAERLTGQTKTENIRESLAYFFREKNNRLSFQNTMITDVLDEVVGMVISYPGEDASVLDEPILSRLRKESHSQEIYFDQEAEPGDYYIDTLSVSPKYQGYGIGTALIKEVEKTAKRMGYSRVSLNVSHDNPAAKGLYEKLGYKKEKVIQINGHDYDYMVRVIEG